MKKFLENMLPEGHEIRQPLKGEVLCLCGQKHEYFFEDMMHGIMWIIIDEIAEPKRDHVTDGGRCWCGGTY